MIRKLAFLLFVALPTSIWAQPSNNAICGNAIKEKREECDDGNQEGGDGCGKFCTIEKNMEPGDVVDVAVGGIFYAPFLGSSISYYYIGDKQNFRRTALRQSAAGLFRMVGFGLAVAGLGKDLFDLDNGEDVTFLRTGLGLTAFGLGSAATLTFNIKTVFEVRDAAEIREQKIRQYREENLEERKKEQEPKKPEEPTTQPY
jgi:cysteine-rich repeat protein